MSDTTIERIARALTRLTREGGNRNRVAVSGPAGHVVFDSVSGTDSIQVQVSAGRQLPKSVTLEPVDYARLHELGLRQRRASENFRFTFPDSEEERALWARHAVTILQRTFGASGPDSLVLRTRYEEVPELDNSGLLGAMDNLAKTRSWSARTGVYTQLIRARLVWALEAPSSAEMPLADAVPFVPEHLGGRPSVVLFPDYAAMDRYDPTGLHGRVATGATLFPVFAALRVGSVLINPKGNPRGELYGNEVLTVADGIKRLSGLH